MKATGIVRRIDDLGRVVIPKEIRRTQCIRQGDPLEIFTSGDGEVIFKKYSSVGAFSDLATRCAEVLSKALGGTVFVCDRDHILTVSGTGKRELLDYRIGQPLEKIMQSRKGYLHMGNPEQCAYPCEGATRFLYAVSPIVVSGDVLGAVALLGEAKATPATAAQMQSVAIGAAILAKQMEE